MGKRWLNGINNGTNPRTSIRFEIRKTVMFEHTQNAHYMLAPRAFTGIPINEWKPFFNSLSKRALFHRELLLSDVPEFGPNVVVFFPGSRTGLNDYFGHLFSFGNNCMHAYCWLNRFSTGLACVTAIS